MAVPCGGDPSHAKAHAPRFLCLPPQAKTVADQAVARLAPFNRRTLDTIAARIYYFLSLAAEALGALAEIRG